MAAQPQTVSGYLASLPDDRRAAIKAVRAAIRKNLPRGYKEGLQYGMIGYFVPHSVYPDGYHCDPKQPLPFVGLGNQKNHMAVYLFCVYTDESLLDWFVSRWKEGGRKLDMGKSCLRFKTIEDCDIDLLGELIAKIPVDAFVTSYESAIGPRARVTKKAAKKSGTKKTGTKKAVTKKSQPKKPAKRRSAHAR